MPTSWEFIQTPCGHGRTGDGSGIGHWLSRTGSPGPAVALVAGGRQKHRLQAGFRPSTQRREPFELRSAKDRAIGFFSQNRNGPVVSRIRVVYDTYTGAFLLRWALVS
jgi:hypothetical protein